MTAAGSVNAAALEAEGPAVKNLVLAFTLPPQSMAKSLSPWIAQSDLSEIHWLTFTSRTRFRRPPGGFSHIARE